MARRLIERIDIYPDVIAQQIASAFRFVAVSSTTIHTQSSYKENPSYLLFSAYFVILQSVHRKKNSLNGLSHQHFGWNYFHLRLNLTLYQYKPILGFDEATARLKRQRDTPTLQQSNKYSSI